MNETFMWVSLSVITLGTIARFIHNQWFDGNGDTINNVGSLFLIAFFGWFLIGVSVTVKEESFTTSYTLFKTKHAAYVFVESSTDPYVVIKDAATYNKIDETNIVFVKSIDMYGFQTMVNVR